MWKRERDIYEVAVLQGKGWRDVRRAGKVFPDKKWFHEEACAKNDQRLGNLKKKGW